MSLSGSVRPASPADPPPPYLDARAAFADSYLAGEGLEIGALHQPLPVPPQARVHYVDRMTTPELRHEYPELKDYDLTEVVVVDDGERLDTVAPESQDFIIANHFLEHCENPIGTIETHLSKLKPGGILFYAVPDKRYTFDFRREPTPIEHMEADYEHGAERSRGQHYEEWVRQVEPEQDEPATRERIEKLEAAKYSIHMHVWTQAEFLELLLTCRRRFADGFDIEAAARSAIEFVVVLRKSGAFPPPLAPPALRSATLPRGTSELAIWRSRARTAWNLLREDIRRRRARS